MAPPNQTGTVTGKEVQSVQDRPVLERVNEERQNAEELQKRKTQQEFLDSLSTEAKKVENSDVSIKAQIESIDPTADVESQEKSLEYVKGAILQAVAGLYKKGVDVSNLQIQDLRKMALENGVILEDYTHEVALDQLPRIMGQMGTTSLYMLRQWPLLVEEGIRQGMNPVERAVDFAKKNPYQAAGYVLIGAGLGYLAVKLVQKIWNSDKEGEKEGFFNAKTITAGLLILSGVGIKEAAKLMKLKNLQKEVEDKIEKGKEAGKEKMDELAKETESIVASIFGKETVEEIKTRTEKIKERAEELAGLKEKGVGEVVEEKEVNKALVYSTTVESLIRLYCLDVDEFPAHRRSEITIAFIWLREVPLQKILHEYRLVKERDMQGISFKSLGLSGNEETNELALFDAAAIIEKSFSAYQKIIPESQNKDLNYFILHLLKDPTIAVGENIHASLEKKFDEMDITNIGDILASPGRLFDTNVISETIQANKDEYIGTLCKKYAINLDGLDEPVRNEFLLAIGNFYIHKDLPVHQSEATTRKMIDKLDPKVQELVMRFVEAVKRDTEKLVPACRDRYDIKRHDKENYNEILRKHFKAEDLSFRDALELTMLSNGIDFSQKASSDSVTQMKDIGMIYAIIHILKNQNKYEAHSNYVGNVVEASLLGSVDMSINPNFEPFLPYFKGTWNLLFKKASRELEAGFNIAGALSDPNEDPDRVDKIAEMDGVEFGIGMGKAALGIPKNLLKTIWETAKVPFNEETNASDVMEVIYAMGGTLIYSQQDGESTGAIYLLGKYYLVEPIHTTWDTLVATLEHDLGVAAKVWTMGAVPYVAIGATYAGIFSHVGFLRGALGGAARGTVAPANVYRSAREGYRWGRFRVSPYNLESLDRALTYFEEYRIKAGTESSTFKNKLEAWRKMPGVKTRQFFLNDVYQKARISYANEFAKFYNEFFGFNPEMADASPLKIQKKNPELEKLIERADHMRNFLDEIKKVNGLNQMNKAQLGELIEDFKTKGLLYDYEAKALTAKLDKSELSEFRKLLAHSSIKSKPSANFAKVEKVKGVPNKYTFMDEAFEITPKEIADRQTAKGMQRGEAIQDLCKEKWSQPRRVSADLHGNEVYRYRGKEFKFKITETAGKNIGEMTDLCEKKFAQSLEITEIQKTKSGGMKYKIGNEWVEMPGKNQPIDDIKSKYMEELKKAGVSLENNRFANTPLVRHWPVLEKLLGPTMAAAMIYHLETAQDKRKAVAETGVALGTFYAGFKAAERATRSIQPKSIPGLIGKGGVLILSGLAVSIGVHEPVMTLVEEFWPHRVGEQQGSHELISLFEKGTASYVVTMGLKSAGKGVARKGIERVGLKSLTAFLDKKVESKVYKRVATFASRSTFQTILKGLGPRGSFFVAAAADEAIPVINILTDIAAVGMAAWMAKDIYDLAVIVSKSYKFKDHWDKHGKKPMVSIEPSDVASEKAMEAAVAMKGVELKQMSEEEKMELIQSIPDIRLKIKREGLKGYEEHRFVKGEIWSTKVLNENGEIIELSDDELNQNISVDPPKEFRLIEVDYTLAPAELAANYRLSILQLKSECGWTKMDYYIENDQKIVVKRLDNKFTTTLTRSGSTWSVEGYKSGLTLQQAVVLANLTNKIHGVLAENDYSGGSNHPFELDGENIDFDKNWNVNDLRIISEESGWVDFYDKIGVKKSHMVEVLNAWYSRDYAAAA